MTSFDGEELISEENPRLNKINEDRIKLIQRKMAKQVKFSRNWKKTLTLLRNEYECTANRRKDFSHKLTSKIIKESGAILTEKLNVKGMSSAGRTEAGNARKSRKRHLNKSILNAAFGQTNDMIRYKALEAGIEFVEVSTQKHKPSQTCPVCMTEKKKLLSERTHECKSCGLLIGRDEASAVYMWRLLLEKNGVERSVVESRLRLIFSEYFVKSRSMKQETMTITS